MNNRDFIIWLKGFIAAKLPVELNVDLRTIKSELDKVQEGYTAIWDNDHQYYPNIFNDGSKQHGCKNPSDCGLPTTWMGIIPPTCHKCGFTPPKLEITYSSVFKNTITTGNSGSNLNNSDNLNSHHNHD
jgi:hypothetical protein